MGSGASSKEKYKAKQQSPPTASNLKGAPADALQPGPRQGQQQLQEGCARSDRNSQSSQSSGRKFSKSSEGGSSMMPTQSIVTIDVSCRQRTRSLMDHTDSEPAYASQDTQKSRITLNSPMLPEDSMRTTASMRTLAVPQRERASSKSSAGSGQPGSTSSRPRRPSNCSTSSRRPSKSSVASSMPSPRLQSEREPSKGSSYEPNVEEIKRLYPIVEFEMTMYANLKRLRPGEAVSLQDFRERPSLDGTLGHCTDVDTTHHVWILMFDGERRARVLPPRLQKEMVSYDHHGQSMVHLLEGYIVYGNENAKVSLDYENTISHRATRDHVPRPATPPEELMVRRKSRETPKFEANASEQEETVVKHKAKREKKREPIHREKSNDPSRRFHEGDQVVLNEAAGLGVGKVIGPGEKPGLVRVSFGQRGAIYTLQAREIHAYDKSPRIESRRITPRGA